MIIIKILNGLEKRVEELKESSIKRQEIRKKEEEIKVEEYN